MSSTSGSTTSCGSTPNPSRTPPTPSRCRRCRTGCRSASSSAPRPALLVPHPARPRHRTAPAPGRRPDRPHRHRHVARLSGPENLIFVLIQTEFGDLRVSFDPHDGSISNLTVSYFNAIPAAIQLGLSRRGTSSARPSLETRLFRAVSFGTCKLVSLEDLSRTTQQCRHLYVLKSVDIVARPRGRSRVASFTARSRPTTSTRPTASTRSRPCLT